MTAQSQSYVALVDEICKSIVDDGDYKLVSTSSTDTTIIEIFAKPPKVGHLIGRNGQLINAIRTILASAATRTHHVVVNVEEMP